MFRLFLLLFLLFSCGKMQQVYSQSHSLLDQKITLEKFKGTSMELVEEIAQRGAFTFSYNSNLPLSDTIELNRNRQTVRKFLELIFEGKDIEFIEHDTYVILRKKLIADSFTLQGYVLAEETKIPVPGANVFIPALLRGTVTGIDGYFEFSDVQGEFPLHISHVGYQSEIANLNLRADSTLNIYLTEKSFDLPGLTISDRRPGEHIGKVEISKNELNIEEIKAMPALFGEVDVLRSLQFLPGIHTGGDISTGLFVRGGSSDQSLIQLNSATLYNPVHFAGLFSVFNPEIIKEVEIYKGNVPVRMGGRLSSVFNNHLKTGSKTAFKGSGGLGLISSRLTLEGPIKKDKASFIISGRRTYFDLFMKLSDDSSVSNSAFYFYDLNAGIDYTPNSSNRLTFSIYRGSDTFKAEKILGMDWGNTIASLNWDHFANKNLVMNTNLSYTRFGYNFLADVKDELEMVWTSAVQEINGKVDFDLKIDDKKSLNFGYQLIGHNFSPTFLKIEDNAASSGSIELDDKFALEQAIYVGMEHALNPKLSLQYGLRYSLFQNIGKGKVLVYENEEAKSLDEVTDTLFYKKGEVINQYHGPEPRVVARYLLDETSSVKAGYSRMRQYIQVASNATAGNPTDRWIPADTYIKPQTSDQFSIGYFKNFLGGNIEASAEVYYRHMNNQIDYKEAVVLLNNIQNTDGSILLNNHLETRLLSGTSWAYGAEFLVKKTAGKFNGWLSYTLSKVQKQIAGINGGKPYSPRYDQTHNISITTNYKISSKFALGVNWVYNTGNAVTYPQGKYTFEGKEVPYYAPDRRNQDRLSAYHRLDLSVTFFPKSNKDRKWHSSWNFSLYNAYFRKNPISMVFREVINDNPQIGPDSGVVVEQSAMKPVMVYLSAMPSITYNFHF